MPQANHIQTACKFGLVVVTMASPTSHSLFSIADFHNPFSGLQQSHCLGEELGKHLAQPAVGEVAAGDPEEPGRHAALDDQFDEVTVLADDDGFAACRAASKIWRSSASRNPRLRTGWAGIPKVSVSQGARLGGSWASTQKFMRPAGRWWSVERRTADRPGCRRAPGRESRRAVRPG